MRLLVVEDEDDHAELILAHLGVAFDQQCTIFRCASLADALRRANQEQFDAALVDLNLPDSRGLETVESFACECAELPLIVLTSLDDETASSRAVRAGAQDYLIKDRLTPETMRRSVRHAIEKKKIIVRLEGVNRDLTNFAHTVAHEIRSPLSTLSFTAKLLSELEDIDNLPRHVERLDRAVIEIDEILAGVLEFAEGAGEEARFPTDLGELVKDVLQTLEAEIRESGAVIRVASRLPTVVCAPIKLRMVFRNLLTNALRYRHEERQPVIVIEPRERLANWQVRVRDNGIGMTESDREVAFGMFQRGRLQGDRPGRGIGLSLCQRIVEAHGGRIWIVSEPDVGTTVHFTLPVEP